MSSERVNVSESTLLMISTLFVMALLYLSGLITVYLVARPLLLRAYILLLPIAAGTLVASPYLTIAKEKLVHDPAGFPRIRRLVDDNTRKMGLNKKVKIYIIESNDLNAFIFGIKKANFAITKGCLERLTENELNALILHELSHVKNRDMWLMTWNIWFIKSATLWLAFYINVIFYMFYVSSDLSLISDFCRLTLISLLIVIVMPLFLIAHFSRTRELVADAQACAILGNSSVLTNTVKKIYRDVYLKLIIRSLSAERKMSRLAFMLVSKTNIVTVHLFSFHPTVSFRIESMQQKRHVADKPSMFFFSWPSVCFGVCAGYIALYLAPVLTYFPRILMGAYVLPELFLKSHALYAPFWYIVLVYLFSNRNVKGYTKLFLRISLSWIAFFIFLLALVSSARALYGWPTIVSEGIYSYSPANAIVKWIPETALFAILSFLMVLLLGKAKFLIAQKIQNTKQATGTREC